MLTGQNIICFAPNTWDDIWRNRHQIMSRLAKQNRILFVEPTVYLRQVTSELRRRGPLALRRAHVYSPLENLWVFQWPRYAPVSGRPPLSNVTFNLRRRSLQRVMNRLNMSDPILWVFQYNLGEMVGHLQERLSIYHAVDEYSAYTSAQSGVNGSSWQNTVRRMEADVIQASDLVFVTSPLLYQSKKHLHSHIYWVPNGVDYDLFAAKNQDGTNLPELAGASRPLIGYSGVINEKLDLVLLNRLAQERPYWQFLFVGPVTLRHDLDLLRTLARQPNTHFVGRQALEALPAYMLACDACLIPYKQNEWTRNISSLKLYEYMATGVPIVTTDIPAAREFSDIVWIDADAGGFTQAIEQALSADSRERRARQQAVARQHTWDQRVEALSTKIAERLAATAR